MKHLYRSASPLALAWALAGTASAMGQTASDASQQAPSVSTAAQAGKSKNSTGLEEIVVTAQRRSENQQRAAVAIDVVTSAAIARAQITSSDQLGKLVPSLQTSSPGGTNPAFYLRGVGTFTSNPYTDSAIAFNYDGVYIGHPNATTGYFYDLARVEVLKGPQGTLYGRNATGGAINVIPQSPEIGKTSGYLTGVYGSYNTVNLQGAINLPVSYNSALRISGTYARHDGYLTDGTSDLNAGAVRVQYVIDPTPDLKIRIAGDYFEHTGMGGSGTLIDTVPINPFTNSFAVVPTGFPNDTGPFDPRTTALFQRTFSGQAGRYLDQYGVKPSIDETFWGLNAQIDWRTPVGTLTIVPAYRHGKTNDLYDTGAFPDEDHTATDQTSVETRLTGNVSSLSYVIGGFYYDESTGSTNNVFNQVLNSYTNLDLHTKSYAGFGRLTYHVTDKLRVVGGLRYTQDEKKLDGDSITQLDICTTGACPGAPLLPVTNSFNDSLAALGLVQVAPGTYVIPTNPAAANSIYLAVPLSQHGELSTSRVTWRGALEYDLAPRNLLYASYETGFRSGGFSFSNTYPTYKPETIDAWTIGSKNRFFDNKLQLNLEAFLWEYSQQQVAHTGTEADGQPNFFTQNIGKSTNKGFEIEARYLATDNTLFNVDAQYLSATYDSFVYRTYAALNPVLSTAAAPVYLPAVVGCPTSGPTNGQYTVDCSGKNALASPKWTISMGVQQTIPVGDNNVILEFDTHYQTSSVVGFDMLTSEVSRGFWRSNASITFSTEGNRFSIGAFVNNIENHRALQLAVYSSPLSAITGLHSDPLICGVRAGYRF